MKTDNQILDLRKSKTFKLRPNDSLADQTKFANDDYQVCKRRLPSLPTFFIHFIEGFIHFSGFIIG
jgi:hypothetical protein